MAKPFLRSVADYIFTNHKDNVENLCIVLPNKRGAIFLKQHLAKAFGNTIWLPAIISAEDLVSELSGLKILEEIDLICHLYESYKFCYGAGAENFEGFAKWGQIILHDFDEIDRYLADTGQLYENLKDIKEIENWSLGAEGLSEYQQNYLHFMNSLGAIYKHFTSFLLQNNWAYSGLAYRKALAGMDNSTYADSYHKLIFCGFNALNTAEVKIIEHYQSTNKVEMLWDADRYYLDDVAMEAGIFMRRNLKVFGSKNADFIGDNFSGEKTIKIISVPKQLGQAHVVKQKLQQLINQNIPMEHTALVLASEKMLWPVLQQLPEDIGPVNITMEYPLRYTPTYALIEQLILLQQNFSRQTSNLKTIYHKDFIMLLRDPLLAQFLKAKGLAVNSSEINERLVNGNVSFISQKFLEKLFGNDLSAFGNLLKPAKNGVEYCVLLLDLIKTLIKNFSENLQSYKTGIELEYLNVMHKSFNRLNDLLTTYPYFSDLNAFKQLFSQVVGSAGVPFVGEPLQGLQIMGVLETRTLDFEHLILVNVNEGVLPSGKSINSFLPHDLKRAFGLPSYTEKDAVYAYHFYRLLQMATDIFITYNSETDSFGKGEKSRFITQLQLELANYNPQVTINEEVATYLELPAETRRSISINKSEEVLKPLLFKALSTEEFGGLSASAMITFKECTLRYYFRYSAGLKESAEIEESAEAGTFGSILHRSLENLYRPFCGKILMPTDLKSLIDKTPGIVKEAFLEYFEEYNSTGKSVLQEEVIGVYVKKLINNDMKFAEIQVQNNTYFALTALEEKYSANLPVQINGLYENIVIHGRIDRIDNVGGITRIIDYKSSVKTSDKFVFAGFEPLFEDLNYNKQFQLIIYAWLLYKNKFNSADKLQPCVVPFKSFSEEPVFIYEKGKTPLVMSEEFFENFEEQLKIFIEKIFNLASAFSQTEDSSVCEFCAYNAICNIQV